MFEACEHHPSDASKPSATGSVRATADLLTSHLFVLSVAAHVVLGSAEAGNDCERLRSQGYRTCKRPPSSEAKANIKLGKGGHTEEIRLAKFTTD